MCRTYRMLLLLFALLGSAWSLWGQGGFDYGNGWYQPGQPYFKLLVTQDGIYRVTQSQLIAAGVDLSGLNATNIHVYYRGAEIPIYVDATGGFSHLEFFGRRNDGRVDSMMYKHFGTHLADPEAQPSVNVSMFSDTSAYFVTWNGTPGLRFIPFNDNNYSSYTPESSFPFESRVDYPTSFSSAYFYETGGSDPNNPFFRLNSDYITGEGYTGQVFCSFATPAAMVLSTPHHAGMGPVELSTRLFTQENVSHSFDVSLNSSFISNESYDGILVRTFSYDLTTSLTASSTVRVNCNTSGDEGRITWVSLRYQRSPNLDGASAMRISGWERSSTAYLAFSNSASTTSAVMYDVAAGYRIPARVIAGTTLQFLVPGAAQPRDLLLATDGGLLTPIIRPGTSLSDLSSTSSGADFIIITHRSLQASAEAYKQYRDTCTANPMTCRIAYVDEIYDEFGYGTVTPWAIKRFCKFAIDEYDTPAQHFMLWGKGQHLTRDEPLNLVPTFGKPATDMEFVSDYDYSTVNVIPMASIGRVCVLDNATGMDYLAKVNEYEHQPYESWMKEGIQLGGGTSTSEQQNIKTALQQESAPYFERPPLGGRMLQWQREGSSLTSNNDLTIDEAISSGANLIHFFGHSAQNVFDIDIRDAEEYTNWGRYPFVIAMGCYGGDFTIAGTSFGERFLLEPGRGSIGYFANTTAGLLLSMRDHSEHLYQKLYRDEAGSSLGHALSEATKAYLTAGGGHTTSINVLNQVKQMALQGDPAIRLHIPAIPDAAISVSDISFVEENPNVEQATFEISIQLRNLGRAMDDSLRVRLEHRAPGGATLTVDTLVPPIWYLDTLIWNLPNTGGEAWAGLNEIEVVLDAPDSLSEYSEANNAAVLQQLINSNAPGIVLPYDFSIVPTDTVTLMAAQQALTTRTDIPYLFEIDTTIFFNSPAKRASSVVAGTSASGTWRVPFPLQVNVVYYWRARFADVNPAVWTTGSFRYLPGQNGWSQGRPHQMLKNSASGVSITQVEPTWVFQIQRQNLHAFIRNRAPSYFLGAFRSSFPEGIDGVNYTPIDHKTLIPVIQDAGAGDWTFCAMPDGQSQIVTTVASMSYGDYFLMASDKSPRLSTWSPVLMSALEEVGLSPGRLSGLADNTPVVMLGRKGYPGSAIVVTEPNFIGSDSIPQYDIDVDLSTSVTTGTIRAVAGPAKAYQTFDWHWSSLDVVPDETASVDVLGVRPDGSTQLLLNDLAEGSYDLSAIDAVQYPSLQLLATLSDAAHLTPPQIDDWTVMYTPVPEATLDPATYFHLSADTVDKGEPLAAGIALRSLIPVDMDSMLLRVWIETQEKARVSLPDWREAPLPGLALDTIHFNLDTRLLSGDLLVHVEVNPDRDQPEQQHFNNLFEFPLHIRPDDHPPLVDVTVDGKHLMEGDIVSPQPEITVMVKDDNLHLPLTVSDSTFEILFGKGRLEEGLERITIEGNPQIEAVLATLPENRSRLMFRPGALTDGEYTLRVTARDQSGNAPSAGKAYEIHFNVVNASSITRVVPYPNPFSSSCRWAYLLTGTEVPYRFEIEIYTISGRMIRRLNLVEEETIRVGYNLSQTIWDGRDEFGDEVANGVYIYKVLVKFRDRDTDIENPGSDRYFSNDFGKIYLMR